MAVISFTKAKNLKAGSKMVAHGGVRNLWLRPSNRESGRSSWVFRFKDPLTGKPAKMVIGQFPELGIAEAGVKAVQLSEWVASGKDPRYLRETSVEVVSTLSQVASRYRETKKQTRAWRSVRTGQLFDYAMGYVLPYLGDLDISQITVEQIANCVLPIWQSKPASANQVLVSLGGVFDWAETMDIIDRNVVRKVRRSLGNPSSEKPEEEQHHPAMPFTEVPLLIKDYLLPERLAPLLIFIILTGVRLSAARLCQHSEIDLSSGTWTVEAFSERRKTRVRQQTPLSWQAQKLVLLSRHPVWVFPSSRKLHSPVYSSSLSKLMGKLPRDVFTSDIPNRFPTVHGFRTTFKSWSRQQGYANELSEIQLWHKLGNRVQQAYDRDPMLEQRREMMQAWADYCFSLCPPDWYEKLR